MKAARILFDVARNLRPRFALEFVDTGGGFGVDYTGKDTAHPAAFVRETLAAMGEAGLDDLALHVEPGRALVARFGILVARVIQRKVSPSSGTLGAGGVGPGKRWLLIDAGMNDSHPPRPLPGQAPDSGFAGGFAPASVPPTRETWRVAGPICESADDFGEHLLPSGGFDEVAILDAGAYGYTMASRYNGRPLPGEVFLRGGRVVHEVSRAPLAAWAKERSFG